MEKCKRLNELLITIALIICLTDNLMLKNSDSIIEDYSKLNILKDKIKDYTLSNSRYIEQIFLWDRYLAYAVSFGIADKIIKRIGNMINDEDLIMVMINERTMQYFLYTDYGDFYRYASLDSRFLKSYGKSISSVAKVYARSIGSGSHGGSGGGFSGGGGYRSGGGRGRRAEELFNSSFFAVKKCYNSQPLFFLAFYTIRRSSEILLTQNFSRFL